jgi:polyisoprenoid-binding protein YceI
VIARGSILALLVAGTAALAANSAAAPPPLFTADPARSTLQFSFRQAGAISTGRFGRFTTGFRFDAGNLAASSLAVTVDLATLDTRDKERDELLRGADLFLVARFPSASFQSTALSRRKDGNYEALGKLTIRGISRQLRLPLAIQLTRRADLTTMSLRGTTVIRRLDFGVGQGDWKSTEWVDNDVTVRFDVLLTTASAPATRN